MSVLVSHLATFSLFNPFSNLFKMYKKRKEYNATVRELSQLSNAELRDIGIHRSQIRSIAMEMYDV